jgi:puromycin-sensitive aminopeptidase
LTIENPYRLPRTVLPSRYEITLTPDLKNGLFSGEVRIDANAVEVVNQISLHAAELEIIGSKVVDKDANEIAATAKPSEDERLILELADSLSAGDCTIVIEFSGSLSSKLSGFYKSTFHDSKGNEKVIATTQFEPTDARKAFPCFDEPDMKAVFEVSLIVDEELFAVSNTKVVNTVSVGDGKKQVNFAPTMRMSTYLVAFIVGPLVATKPVVVDGIEIRVVCTPERANLADFALECAESALKYFSQYFEIPYPGDKLDLVGIPDFNFGAMENLGCVTFRETALLVDREHASRLELERVADVIGHEIAHMWFGDLVTMKWWNGIWLNEAFATFMELMFVDQYRPDWERWTSFGISRAYALSTDGLASTRTIEYPVLHPRDAEGMFDVAITYQKGGAVVRMLEQYLEPGEFQRGIARYLSTHKYGNTETTDLWDAIEAETGEPVRALMDSWIFQEGHPSVVVSRSDDNSQITLRQNRFLYIGARGSETHWHIPIRLRVSVNGDIEKRKVLLTEGEMTINFNGNVDWALVNDGSWGFYRVQYDSDLLRALTSQLESLNSLERFSLLSDSWASVLSGNAPVSDFLELARLFKNEDDPDVWTTLIGPLDSLSRAGGNEDTALVQDFVRELCSKKFSDLGWAPKNGESQRTNTTRAVLIGALGYTANDPDIQSECRQLLDKHLAGEDVSPDLLQTIINVCAFVGGSDLYSKYQSLVKDASTPQEEIRYLRALGRFNNKDLVKQTVLYTLEDDVRPQDGMFVLAGALSNPQYGKDGWEVMKERWDDLLARLAPSTIGRSIEAMRDQFSPGIAADVRAFIQAHPVPQNERLLAQTVEHLEVNEAFGHRLGNSLRSALGK